MIYKKVILKALVFLTLLSSVFLQPIILRVNAQEEDSDVMITQTGNGISVSPIRIQRNYKGGDKDLIKFTLLNNEDTATSLSVTVRSFKLVNNNQDISFDQSVEETILDWIRNFKNSVTLEPKEKYEYNLELNIGTDTAPGGYLFGIFFEAQGKPNDTQSEAVIKQSIGVPLIINVAGVAGISYGDVALDTYDVSYNSISNSINYSITILNNSNQIITPAGLTTVKKLFGIGPDEITSTFNTQGKIINSFSLRTFDKEIYFNQFAFGKYEATLNFLYGLENNVFTQKTTLLVIPIWVPIIIIGVLLIVIKKVRNRKSANVEE